MLGSCELLFLGCLGITSSSVKSRKHFGWRKMASLLFFVMGPALAGVSCCWPLEAMGVEKVQVGLWHEGWSKAEDL